MRLHAEWNRYWFDSGGRVAAAVVRIALAAAVLLLLVRLHDLPPIARPDAMAAAVYRPVGLLLLVSAPPPSWLIAAASVVAWTAASAMLIGLCSRIACAVTALAAVMLASQAMSFQQSWSHDFPIVLTALIAFLGARGGDTLSLDAALRRRRGDEVPADACYQWSLRLVQLAVGLMFVSACASKLRAGGVWWAWSDNLRHQLLARYDLLGEVHRPAIVDWLLADEWRYHVAAACSLIAQAVPLGAIVFASRPIVRAIAAVVFIAEIVGLHVVMQFGNPSWFPLAAVFVDWDALAKAARPAVAPRVGLAPRIFVAVFVAYDLVISFVPSLDQRLRTFPFSGFPMFAAIRAKAPYDVHQSYELVGQRIELIAAMPTEPWIQAELDRDYAFRSLYRERDPARLRARMGALIAEVRSRYPQLGIRGARLLRVTYQVPAYPAPARLVERQVEALGQLVGGTWTPFDGNPAGE
ncbi:MAG TPA: hypothetical protein VIV58_15250 [Kofleriaceae bacterium]